jgi:hypothetical protein
LFAYLAILLDPACGTAYKATPLTFLKNTFAHCTVALDDESVGFWMVDALFNSTTKLFNTNPPKLWPINTIG